MDRFPSFNKICAMAASERISADSYKHRTEVCDVEHFAANVQNMQGCRRAKSSKYVSGKCCW